MSQYKGEGGDKFYTDEERNQKAREWEKKNPGKRIGIKKLTKLMKERYPAKEDYQGEE